MKRSLTQSEASRVSGGFDHLPSPPSPPPVPSAPFGLQDFLRSMEEQAQQELMELLAPPGQ